MTIHIFNPEHDISLANGMKRVTPPHAARQLRHDLGFIPALWAHDGDMVLVEDKAHAERAYDRVRQAASRITGMKSGDVSFIDPSDLRGITADSVSPWGWDYSVRASLATSIVNPEVLPSDESLADISRLSHRRTAATLLPLLQFPGTIGSAVCCTSRDEVIEALWNAGGDAVFKAPWSSSGRGVRFVTRSIDNHTMRWVINILKKQHAIMVEPRYRRVIDFGMEFESHGDGTAAYSGLSLFTTANGAYTGNVLATESRKSEKLSRYVSADLLANIRSVVCSRAFSALTTSYRGPFGIDMMVVASPDRDGFLVHPCVEINLRRTMGHLALSLSPSDDDIEGVMQVVYEDKFKLRVSRQALS